MCIFTSINYLLFLKGFVCYTVSASFCSARMVMQLPFTKLSPSSMSVSVSVNLMQVRPRVHVKLMSESSF